MALLIGADPELFLKKGAVFHSGYGVIPGTKAEPHPVEDGAIQIDGMAVEFNINPAHSYHSFRHNIQSVMAQLRNMIPKEFDLEISPVANFSEEHMAIQPDDAKRLGCDPDYNAYSQEANPAPNQHPVMRTAAGHLHLGWCEGRDPHAEAHFISCCSLVKQLDVCLGVPSVLLDPDTERKKMYGKAGAFRPKPYGVEYRVLSNFWLKDEALMNWAYNTTEWAFNELAVYKNSYVKFADRAREIINENNKAKAFQFCDDLGIPYRVQSKNTTRQHQDYMKEMGYA